MLYWIGYYILRALCRLFGRVQIFGQENIPPTGGLILAANHTSYIDPPLIGSAQSRPVWFMAKSELFTVPVFGKLISRVHAFPVKRGSADRSALRRANELLTAGEVLTVFFEGRRSRDGRLQSPELGMAMIALRANVPIVPVAAINADKLLPSHSGRLHFSRVTVAFGTPLTFPHLAGKAGDRAALQEVSEATARSIAEMMRAHGAADRVPEGYLEGGECRVQEEGSGGLSDKSDKVDTAELSNMPDIRKGAEK